MNKLYIICYFIINLSAFLVQCSEIFTKEFTAIQNELFSDIFELKGGFGRLEVTVDVLNKRHLHQLNELKSIMSSCAEMNAVPKNSQYTEDICEEVLYFSNETVTKYDEFNAKLNTKLQEFQKTQLQSLENILNNKKIEQNCESLKPKQTALDSVLANIESKVSKMEQQLSEFEILQEKLSLQQKKYEKLNDDQLKILQKIKEKLIQHENKFVKYEKDVPDMNNFSNKISNLSNWSRWRHRHSAGK